MHRVWVFTVKKLCVIGAAGTRCETITYYAIDAMSAIDNAAYTCGVHSTQMAQCRGAMRSLRGIEMRVTSGSSAPSRVLNR